MVAAGPTQPTAEMPFPNVPLIHRPDEVPAAVTLSRAPLQIRKRLLIVDDEHPVLKLIVRILASDNYEIQSTDSGVEAARLLDASGFRGVDLLITDLMMPGMTGRQLAEEVRKHYPSVRALYVTGFAGTLFKGVNELRRRIIHREAVWRGGPARGCSLADVRPHHRQRGPKGQARQAGRVGRRSPAHEVRSLVEAASIRLNP